MSIVREGMLEKVRVFAYAQTSSFIERHAQHSTVKSLSIDSGVAYNTLLGIKNMKLKSISLQRLTQTMKAIGMDFSMNIQYKGGIELIKMEIDRAVYDPKVQKVLKRETMEQLLSQTR